MTWVDIVAIAFGLALLVAGLLGARFARIIARSFA